MIVSRLSAALAAAVVLLATLTRPAAAGPERSDRMPEKPVFGAPAAEAMPTIAALPDAATAAAGVAPGRLDKTLRAVAAANDPPLRGRREQRIYRRYARSVVLIIQPEGSGSGAVIDDDGTIVTNWHVVAGYKSVGVIFKPKDEAGRPRVAEAVQAKVLFIDEIADLALIKVEALPKDVEPLDIGDHTKLAVGADVHAIGHPVGEAWSYTQGTVSQIRPNYEWLTESGILHRADVIQTQTPINPGNSGGPLLDDDGDIVGINAFGAGRAELINFAVASGEIERFVKQQANRLAPVKTAAPDQAMPQTALPAAAPACQAVKLDAFRSSRDDATGYILDTNCDGIADAILVVPDAKSQPVELLIDANQNDKLDAVYVDEDHDFRFDYVLFDTDEDGTVDLIGSQLDENLKPARILAAKA